MAFYDTADAVYGVGTYGSASHGRVTPVIQVTGVGATVNTRTIHLNVFEVDITEPIYNAPSGTGSVGSLTPNTAAGVTGVSATATANTLGVGVDVTLGSVSATVSTNTVSENITLRPWTYSGDGDRPIVGTSEIGSVTLTTVNNVSVTGVSATATLGTLQEVKTSEALESVSATASLGTIKPNLKEPIATGLVGTTNTPSVDASNTSSIVPTGVVATGEIGDLEEKPTEVVDGVSATVSIGIITVNILERMISTNLTGTMGSVSTTAIVFDFEAVKTQYSRRRTVILPRVA